MDILKKFLVLLLLVLFYKIGIAQERNYSTKSKKSISYFEKAQKEYNNQNLDKAVEFLNLAISKDSSFYEAYLLKAQIYNQQKKDEDEIECYKLAYRINPEGYHNGYFHLAKALLSAGKYQEAKYYFELLEKYDDINKSYQDQKIHLLEKCAFGIHALANPVNFTPYNVGNSINTVMHEYWPSLNADETIMVFTRLLPKENQNNLSFPFKTHHEDLFISQFENNMWVTAQSMPVGINTAGNEGTQSLSLDGNAFYFTACSRSDGFGDCDIYYVEIINDKWSEPINLGDKINTKAKESQPSISSDGQYLYFVSNRPGGKGKLDIWKSRLSTEGYWETPVNLGDTINTQFDEQSPFIHADNTTFYFSSEGHLGMGGSDIFMSRMDSSGEFTKAINIGFPINTHKDELGLFITPMGNRAYYATNMDAEKGKDIFYFEMPANLKPLPVIYVKGVIKDAITKKKLLANLELVNLNNSETVSKSTSNEENGKYIFTLVTNENYALNVSKRGYLFHSEHFSLLNIHDTIKSFALDVQLYPIAIGSSCILNNIFFGVDSYELKNESYVELKKLKGFINENPEIAIEIGGHTDDTGSEEYNLNLSAKRVETVYNYLLSENIEYKRLSFKGYGATKPLESNSTPEGKAKNRRTEFTITSK